MRLAIVKPDHIGDLVLSSPAIRAMAAAADPAVVFVAPKCVALARWLFPDVDVRPVALPHLVKDGEAAEEPDLTGFDLVAILRQDAVIDEGWARLRTRDYVLPVNTLEDHQTVIDYACAFAVCGDYDIDAAFHPDGGAAMRARAQQAPRRVGLAIGSGFHTNGWPVVRWIELARILQQRDLDVVVLGGASERAQAEAIAAGAGLGREGVRLGGGEFAAFLADLADVDLTIASDGGTAHLCSLVTPMVSLFGPSPFARYAPFGRWNRAVSLRLPCSPCYQYAAEVVNGCLSVECMGHLGTADALRAMELHVPADPRPFLARQADGRWLALGLSHLGRGPKIEARRLEQTAWLP